MKKRIVCGISLRKLGIPIATLLLPRDVRLQVPLQPRRHPAPTPGWIWRQEPLLFGATKGENK